MKVNNSAEIRRRIDELKRRIADAPAGGEFLRFFA